MNRKLQATAYHEAGHVFADWHFGYKVKSVTIVPKGDSAGHVVSKCRLHFRALEYSTPPVRVLAAFMKELFRCWQDMRRSGTFALAA